MSSFQKKFTYSRYHPVNSGEGKLFEKNKFQHNADLEIALKELSSSDDEITVVAGDMKTVHFNRSLLLFFSKTLRDCFATYSLCCNEPTLVLPDFTSESVVKVRDLLVNRGITASGEEAYLDIEPVFDVASALGINLINLNLERLLDSPKKNVSECIEVSISDSDDEVEEEMVLSENVRYTAEKSRYTEESIRKLLMKEKRTSNQFASRFGYKNDSSDEETGGEDNYDESSSEREIDRTNNLDRNTYLRGHFQADMHSSRNENTSILEGKSNSYPLESRKPNGSVDKLTGLHREFPETHIQDGEIGTKVQSLSNRDITTFHGDRKILSERLVDLLDKNNQLTQELQHPPYQDPDTVSPLKDEINSVPRDISGTDSKENSSPAAVSSGNEYENRFRCTICHVIMRKLAVSTFKEHYSTAHFAKDIFDMFIKNSSETMCKISGCGKDFGEKHKANLVRHIGSTHNKAVEILNMKGMDVPAILQEINVGKRKKSSTNSERKSRVKLESTEASFECPACGVFFSSQSNLDNHIYMNH